MGVRAGGHLALLMAGVGAAVGGATAGQTAGRVGARHGLMATAAVRPDRAGLTVGADHRRASAAGSDTERVMDLRSRVRAVRLCAFGNRPRTDNRVIAS